MAQSVRSADALDYSPLPQDNSQSQCARTQSCPGADYYRSSLACSRPRRHSPSSTLTHLHWIKTSCQFPSLELSYLRWFPTELSCLSPQLDKTRRLSRKWWRVCFNCLLLSFLECSNSINHQRAKESQLNFPTPGQAGAGRKTVFQIRASVEMSRFASVLVKRWSRLW